MLPANVLLPASSDWLAAAVPLILQQDLASSPSAYAFTARRSSDSYPAPATTEVQVTVEADSPLRYTVDVRDLSTQQSADMFTEVSSGSAIASIDAIAKRLDGHASAFSTRSDAALRAYVQGMDSTAVPERVSLLQQAVAADPSFGLAYLSLLETEMGTLAADVPAVISAAEAHQASFSAYERARLNLVLAGFARKSLAKVADAAEAVVKVAPHNVEAFAQLGRIRFLQGNGAAGQQATSTALQLTPADARLQQQLATGFLQTRQFALAEQTWAQTRDVSAPLASQTGAAIAMLLAGERDRASAALGTSLSPETGSNPSAPVVRAQWAAISSADPALGPQRGLLTLQSPARLESDVAASASLQKAIWLLQAGDQVGARNAAAQGVHGAASPAVKQTAEAVSLIVEAGSAPALRSRIQRLHVDNVSKNFVLGYGFFLYRDYAAAVEPWRTLVADIGDTDLRSRDMLAACLHRAGINQDAFAIVVEPFVPNLTGTDPFATIAFNEMRRLLRL